MVPSRSCIVSFTDSMGIEHRVQVSAASLFEAAALGIGEFRKSGFTEINIGPTTRLSVKIKMPKTSHVVSVGKLVDWAKMLREESKRADPEESIADYYSVLDPVSSLGAPLCRLL